MPRDVEVKGEFDPRLSGGLPAGWRARVSDFERSPVPTPGDFVLDRIQLEVWWTSGAQRHTFALDGYRWRTLKMEDLGKGTQ